MTTFTMYRSNIIAKAKIDLDNNYYDVVDYYHEVNDYDTPYNDDILINFIVDEFIKETKKKKYHFSDKGGLTMKKYIIEETLENIGEIMMSDKYAYDSERMVNADIKEHIKYLQSLYERLDEETGGDEETCALGDIINLLNLIKFRAEESEEE